MSCPFCEVEDVVLENDLAYAKYDSYPVSKGHMLIIPKRHAKDWFELDFEEQTAMLLLLSRAKEMLDERFSPNGYNIGLNCGEYAGQTIMHAHLHLIPRYKGDVENPRGGVRAVIAAKKDYPTAR